MKKDLFSDAYQFTGNVNYANMNLSTLQAFYAQCDLHKIQNSKGKPIISSQHKALINHAKERIEHFKQYETGNINDMKSPELVKDLIEFGLQLVTIHVSLRRLYTELKGDKSGKFQRIVEPIKDYAFPEGITFKDFQDLDRDTCPDVFMAANQHCFSLGRLLYSGESKSSSIVPFSGVHRAALDKFFEQWPTYAYQLSKFCFTDKLFTAAILMAFNDFLMHGCQPEFVEQEPFTPEEYFTSFPYDSQIPTPQFSPVVVKQEEANNQEELKEEESKEVKDVTMEEVSQASNEPVFGIKCSSTPMPQEDFNVFAPEGIAFSKKTTGKVYCPIAKTNAILYSGVVTLKDGALQPFFFCSAARIKTFCGFDFDLGGRTNQAQKEQPDKLMVVKGKSVSFAEDDSDIMVKVYKKIIKRMNKQSEVINELSQRMEGFTADDLRKSFENLALEMHQANGKVVESNARIVDSVQHIDAKMDQQIAAINVLPDRVQGMIQSAQEAITAQSSDIMNLLQRSHDIFSQSAASSAQVEYTTEQLEMMLAKSKERDLIKAQAEATEKKKREQKKLRKEEEKKKKQEQLNELMQMQKVLLEKAAKLAESSVSDNSDDDE